jgi:hypothetical protein
MRMQFRRMSGALILEREWPAHGRPVEEIAAEAIEALTSCYEGDAFSFWPKKAFAPDAPEEVRVIDADGAIIARCDLTVLLGASRRSLLAGRNA